MQKLTLSQSLQQKLSPQQIQFIKLLEVPTAELDSRIEEELEINPALEEGTEIGEETNLDSDIEEDFSNIENDDDTIHLDNYLGADDKGYKMQSEGDGDEEDKEIPIADESSLLESLHQQLVFSGLNERQLIIGDQLIGSIDEDGYIHRKMDAIVNDLAFTQNIDTDKEEVESILYKIQEFEPAGIGARNLQECLLLQIRRKDLTDTKTSIALQIIEDCFEEFVKKHYDKICKKLNIDEDTLKLALKVITRCNPKPGENSANAIKSQYIIPDFILTNINGKLEVTLNSKNAPELKISASYIEMFDTYDKSAKTDKKMKEAVQFVKQKLDSAKWFIDAIKQRQETLLATMRAIVQMQYEYFLDGDESKLKPMILKDIADKLGMDISTVSRVANSKSVQTEFGTLPLKYFFSEGIATDSGEDVSSKEIKNELSIMIAAEDKSKPLSDEELEKLLKAKGYPIARRTVAKYREQLNIPVARLRKEI
ncbi:MAG: RNA polymerase factor sigma-54 [Bacteroidota bacterium]|nr:RNA polymerase factor sigma-54 [Bacteroidota bacterium]